MYISTFYSFKGGVGRTMALMNVGFELARRGRKVLLVDFDLEAPGLTTYPGFCGAKQSKGLVEYVTEYMETNVAPRATEFLYQFHSPDGNAPCAKSVWLMPSGRRDASYAARLNAIDWLSLYQDRSGYLLFEDLKQQWESEAKFDYVLIDSRTGHTDVGGICTRQMPDSVVFMFFPNEQNIAGLEVVVEETRAEAKMAAKKINLLFCPSNVPNLDDENEILKNQMLSAEKRLKYTEAASIVHRYDSLALLEQAVFVDIRPKSRLAEEYRVLTSAVIQGNIEDKEGALSELREIRSNLDQSQHPDNVRGSSDLGETPILTYASTKIEEIRKHHPNDGEVAWQLAFIFSAMGNNEGEIEALSSAIDQGHRVGEAYLRRADCLLRKQQQAEAASDLRSVLGHDAVDALSLINAIELLKIIDPDWISFVKRSSAIARLDLEDQATIAYFLLTGGEGTSTAIEIAQRVLDATQSQERNGRTCLILSLGLIGSGRFSEAMRAIEIAEPDIASSHNVTQLFNYAMAQWGVSKRPPIELLEKIVQLAEGVDRAVETNFAQCISLAYAVLGKTDDARRFLDLARELLSPGPAFSCWRYQRVDRRGMSADLDMLESLLDGAALTPAFLLHPEPDSMRH